MAGLRRRIKRAQRDAQAEGVVIELRDGDRRVFTDLEVWSEMFLTKMDLFRGKSRPSEVLAAVRAATPESRRAFEEQYGSIEMTARIVEGGFEGAWVEVYRLDENGAVTVERHEGGTPEAERFREEARQSSPAF